MPQDENTSICPYCKESCAVGYGYCHCGCGEKTNPARQNNPALGWVKGTPLLYKRFHHKLQPRATTEEAVPFKIDSVYCRLIPLTRGQYTIVWESDYWWLSKRSWCARWDKTGHSFYAGCGAYDEKGKLHGISMHRMILGLSWGDEEIADHINGITLDNRRSNLRITDKAGNAHNRKRQTSNNTGYKGVREDSRKNGSYSAFITYRGELIYLGCDRDPYKAHLLYVEAAKKYFGEFARFK